ncbi:uncharacterized protein LOC130694766 [Daphnia carinata]|uniref:uncharacterized protein LOC130694766 n=1 Tax=Daphnia carinata TaxID=120202 RepID=UPI0025810442|nr:uncharacterized protein LOC130694766 [Daphnia carinata]XP_057373841.1 uncharacterized protein LOC130694766 [Daphnia carinata]
MDRSEFCTAVTLLAVLFVTANCQGEPREWTSAFGRWTTPSTTSTTKIHHIEQNRPVSICDDKCCECFNNKSRVECTSSSTCKEFVLNQNNRLPKEAKTVIITGFHRLKVTKGSLDYSQNLQLLTIERVEQIETEPYALSQPSCSSGWRHSLRPTLFINASSIANLKRRTLTGAWNEIIISHSNVKLVESESFFNVSCLKKLTIEGNSIMEIKSKALSDSEAQYLVIKSNEIRSIENGAFHVNVTDSATIASNKLNDIQSEAFVLHTPRIFKFLNNTVGNLYPYAFQLAAKEKIDFISNTFKRIARHAFHAIKTMGSAKITIAITIEKFDNGAFDLNESLLNSSLQKVDIKMIEICDCRLEILLDTLFSTHGDPKRKEGTNVRSIIRDSVSCKTDKGMEKFLIFALFHGCQSSTVLFASIGGVTLVVLLLFGIGVTLVVRRKKKFRRSNTGTSKVWMMHAYTESECKVDEEFVHPLETVGENGPVLFTNQSEKGS